MKPAIRGYELKESAAVNVSALLRQMLADIVALNNASTRKALVALCLIGFTGSVTNAQTAKPCDKWLTDFIQVAPKTSDGESIATYVAGKLQNDNSLISAVANCMVGLRIAVNCNGEFSYDKMEYPNSSLSAVQCSDLLQATVDIIKGIKLFSPGTISNQKKDFVFKLVVKVTHSGKAKAEILY
jgi:hypothetical protein